MKSIYQLLLLVIFSTPAFTFAQNSSPDNLDDYCGSRMTPEWDAKLDKNLRKMRSGNYQRSNVVKYAPLSVHLMAETNGTSRYSDVALIDRLCELNQQFEQADIQFYLAEGDGLHYYDNSGWYDGTGFSFMVASTKISNSLNLYVQGTAISSGNIVCGFYSPNQDVTVVQKSCFGAGNTTAMHELGHLFTLPHTFSGLEGQVPYVCGNMGQTIWEKVDGSNCANVADRFCDTGPDYLNDRWTCNVQGNSNCEHIDANGESFFPSGRNTMSYSNDQCVNQFSGEQITAMTINYEDDRMDIHPTTAVTANEITDAVTLSEPLDNSNTVGFESIEFKWVPVQHATRYIVQISNSASFGGSSIVHSEFVTSPQFVFSGNLSQFATYYWRIKPINDFYFCAPFSDSRAFTTTDQQVGVNEIDGVHSIKLYPNPSNEGNTVTLELHSDKTVEGQIKVFSVQGKLISSNQITITNSQNRYDVSTHQLSSGVYVVSLETNEGTIQEKLVVNK